jgi:DNA polymerase-3 subunit epsilon
MNGFHALLRLALFHSLINPECEVTPGARAVHGITDEELAEAPRLPDLWPQIQEALVGRSLILSYGVDFDEAVMNRSARRYQLPELTQKWDCLKEWYAQYYGEWSDYWGNYKWQPLDGGHRALADAQAALRLLKMMAATKLDEGDEDA